ncbi:MAG: WbqC family protein [Alphaproteobacteria bacterium]
MKLAIMQPYFMPYIGYWQLINAVDTFVIFDDVNFINKGYINRNSILVNNQPYRFTLELKHASQNKFINQTDIGENSTKILKTVEQSYKKASQFKAVFPLLENIFLNTEKNLAKYIGYSIVEISKYLDISTSFVYSSKLSKDNDLKGQDKIIAICKALEASDYINAIGGVDLYDKSLFKKQNITLSFIKNIPTAYPQFNHDFIPNLSIIDVLMFNHKNMITEQLNSYELI